MADVFFDDEKVMIVTVVYSERANEDDPYVGPHMGEVIGVFGRDFTDEEIAAALRRAWAGEGPEVRTQLPKEDFDASWDPVCEAFGVDDYHPAVKSVNANSVHGSAVFVGSKKYGQNRKFVDHGRSKMPIDSSDADLAAGLRDAIDATHS